jgi:predicted RecA/RadA family phage recombinase
MTTARFIQDGKSIDYTPGADVSAGDVVVQGDLVGIAQLDIASGALGALAVTGVFDLPKTAGVDEGIAAGAKVYWDVADAVAKTDAEAGANKYLGKTVAAAGDDDTTVRVRLEQ